MIFPRLTFWLGLAALGCARLAAEEESNFWPGPVARLRADGTAESWTALGPLLFSQPSPAGGRVAGFRPFYVERTSPTGEKTGFTVLYPLFYYRTYGDSYEWSIFKLINRFGRRDGAPPTPETDSRNFDVWPLYFSRETGDPATTYHALLPIAGTILNRLGYERLSWTLFPLYVQSEKRGATTTYTPWPIIRVTKGTEHGFAIWPLFGHLDRPGAFDRNYYLWPLIWNNTLYPGPEAPPDTPVTRQTGVLPFFTSEVGARGVDKNYLFFFGYTDRPAPKEYHEQRYFWPFLVHGWGPDRTIDRWGPFYTHSVIKGTDKTWVMWPLWKHTSWEDAGIAEEKSSLLWFIFWHRVQRSLTNPAAAPAEKTYLWPLFSTWNNGAGRRQVQILSPFEGAFADNDDVRSTWSPLFAVWRYDQSAPGEVRASLLWNAVTWSRSAAADRAEFHLGPLFSTAHGPSGRRWSLGNGLMGWKRAPGETRGHFFWLEFPGQADKLPAGP